MGRAQGQVGRRTRTKSMSIHVLGSINMDVVTTVEHLPRPGETVTGKDLAHYPGGKGANQAVAAARLGADVSLYGAVGADDYGATMRDYLRSAGVCTVGVVEKTPAATGQAYISVSDDGENAIVVVPGANHAFAPQDLPATSARRGILLTQFEMPLDTIRRFFERVENDNSVRVINAAPAVTGGESLFPLAEIIILNEVELDYYCGRVNAGKSVEELARHARALLNRNGQRVIVTLGAKGALSVSLDGSCRVESQPAPVVDTTGAGDCFCGALAAALDRGDELRDAITYANVAAAIAVGRKGAASSMPTTADMAGY